MVSALRRSVEDIGREMTGTLAALDGGSTAEPTDSDRERDPRKEKPGPMADSTAHGTAAPPGRNREKGKKYSEHAEPDPPEQPEGHRHAPTMVDQHHCHLM